MRKTNLEIKLKYEDATGSRERLIVQESRPMGKKDRKLQLSIQLFSLRYPDHWREVLQYGRILMYEDPAEIMTRTAYDPYYRIMSPAEAIFWYVIRGYERLDALCDYMAAGESMISFQHAKWRTLW